MLKSHLIFFSKRAPRWSTIPKELSDNYTILFSGYAGSTAISTAVLKSDPSSENIHYNDSVLGLYCGRNDCPGNPLNQTNIHLPEQSTVCQKKKESCCDTKFVISIFPGFSRFIPSFNRCIQSCYSNFPPAGKTHLSIKGLLVSHFCVILLFFIWDFFLIKNIFINFQKNIFLRNIFDANPRLVLPHFDSSWSQPSVINSMLGILIE